MTGSSYPASRSVAPRLASHFKQLHRAGASVPDAEAIEALIAAAFWASLRRQEGYSPTISLVYLSPDEAMTPLRFEKPLSLVAESLARLAPAVERPGIHLGVWPHNGDLAVWGATHTLPSECLVVEVFAPGLLAVKQSVGEDEGKFINLAVLEGDQVKELNTLSLDWPDCPPVIRSLLGLGSSRSIDSSRVLVHLASSMRRHKRGGSLLIVPRDSDQWRRSVISPMSYAISPLYSELHDRLQSGGSEPTLHDTIQAIDLVAGLTAVDGASVLTEDCSLLAFGVKIVRRANQPVVDRVIESEPVGAGSLNFVHPTQLGGTRHLSAAQFAQDQRDSVALVASQDGRFTVFAWSPSHETVHAYRVESLLL
jgi:hypothetical protein